MGYQNMTAPQLKVDKELSGEASGQAQMHAPRSDNQRDQSLYWRYFLWHQNKGLKSGVVVVVVVVMVVVKEAGQRLVLVGSDQTDWAGGWVVLQSLRRTTHLDELPSLGIKHN